MLVRLGKKTRVLGILVCCLIIWYTLYFSRLTKLPDDKTFPHIGPTLCRWPPATPNEIRITHNTYNITICVQVPSRSLAAKSVTTYPIQSLFRNVKIDNWVSYKEMGECDPSIFKYPIYPDVYRTYPQDVPIKSIINAIKSGSPVSEASFTPKR